MSRLAHIESFFASWRFPTFALATIVSYELVLLGIILLPGGDGAVGSFADEFRKWCFGFDPSTGSYQWIYVFTTFTSPLVVVLVIWLTWSRQLKEVFRLRPFATIPYLITATALSVTIGASLILVARESANGQLAFPSEALRTTIKAPTFELVDHERNLISMADMKGRVTLVTAVYASCGDTCPMIFADLKKTLSTLDDTQLRDLTVLGITLDPNTDTPDVLANLASGQHLSAPLVHLLTGEPEYVERILDQFNFARSRDPLTGVIDHANLFILIDRAGRIAYRFTLGERQRSWLQSALRILIDENRD